MTGHVTLAGENKVFQMFSKALRFFHSVTCLTTLIPDACSEEEEQLSRTMMSYWGNFARTG